MNAEQCVNQKKDPIINNTPSMIKFIFATIMLLSLASCGKKGPLQPPPRKETKEIFKQESCHDRRAICTNNKLIIKKDIKIDLPN